MNLDDVDCSPGRTYKLSEYDGKREVVQWRMRTEAEMGDRVKYPVLDPAVMKY